MVGASGLENEEVQLGGLHEFNSETTSWGLSNL